MVKVITFGKKSSQDYFKKLKNSDKEILEDFKRKISLKASKERSEEALKEILRFKLITKKPLDQIELSDLEKYIGALKESNLSENFKNKIKGFIHMFLKWKYKDWSERFDGFESIEYITGALRIKEIKPKDVLNKEDLDKILETEKNLFWKTFFIVQYESAGRTGEIRRLLWADIDFDTGDEFVEVALWNKKNKQRIPQSRELPLKHSKKFLLALKKQQEAEGIKSKFVFPSPKDPRKPISKAVNQWFNNLTKKAIGRTITPYLLRHSRGTELAHLVKENKMSKDIALKFMGHTEKMFDNIYSHVAKEKEKELMKKQIYDFEYLTEEEKIQVKELKAEIEKLKKDFGSFAEKVYKGKIIIARD